MRHEMVVLLILATSLMISAPAAATGMGMVGPRSLVSPEDAYCINNGGTPQSGKCYFPDGSYCDSKAFYNGTCPSRENIEQRIWEAEAYRFLYSDYCPECNRYPQSYAEGSAMYWLNLGNSMYSSGRYNESISYYTSAVQVDPTLADAWLNMGNAFFFAGRYSEAFSAYDRVTALKPDSTVAWNGKGWALKALGREAEASEAFARAGAASPV